MSLLPPPQEMSAGRTALALVATAWAPLTGAMSLGFTSPSLDTMQGKASQAGLPPPEGLVVFAGAGGSEAASWFSSLINVGALLGALGGGWFREQVGLTGTLRTAGALMGCAMLWVAISHDVHQLLAARVVIGLGVGLQSVAAPALIAELAPPRFRGVLGMLNAAAIILGAGAAFIFGGFVFRAGPSGEFCNWRQLALFVCGMATVILAGSFAGPRSPPLGVASPLAALTMRRISAGLDAAIDTVPEAGLWQQMKGYRRLVLAGLVPMLWQQLSGINSVIFFGQSLLAGAGLKQGNLMGVSVLVVQFIGVTFVAAPLVERLGRRPLLVASAAGMGCGAAALSICLHFLRGSWLAVLALYAYVLAFAIGLGPVPWLLLPELGLPRRVRFAAASIATAANWGCSFLVTGPPLHALADAVGLSGAYLVLSGICFLGAALMAGLVPETMVLQRGIGEATEEGTVRIRCRVHAARRTGAPSPPDGDDELTGVEAVTGSFATSRCIS